MFKIIKTEHCEKSLEIIRKGYFLRRAGNVPGLRIRKCFKMFPIRKFLFPETATK